jgi:peptidoglycan/LPS O-acetylase OafA/YrhL
MFMHFRRDINGLRAIAVIAVMLFHFSPTWLPGGFAGVDIFFVISGYLITGIIFRGMQENTFSLVSFYLSRAQRIIPALAVMCTVLLLFGWFYLLPLQYSDLGKHVASSLSFISNHVYRSETGYFTTGAQEKWLLHTWTLSVEWQFYMVYPVILLLLSKVYSLPVLRRLVVGACAVGFVFCAIYSFRSPERAFYLLPARAWELLVGGVIYLYPFTLKGHQKRALEGLGLLMIALSFYFLSEKDVWPGYLSLLPVIGTMLVICASRDESVLTNNPLSQWTGKVSYSLYLWHWPVVVFMSNTGYLQDPRYVVLGIVVSFALAFVSYTLIEQRRVRKSPYQWKFATACALVALVIAGGAAVNSTHGAVTPMRDLSVSERARFVNEYASLNGAVYEAYWIQCDAFSALFDRGQKGIDPSCITKRGEGGVLLWGDSHAQALSKGLRTSLPKETPFYQVTSAGCKPSLAYNPGPNKSEMKVACDYSNKTALESIQNIRPDMVVLAQKDEHDKTDWSEIAARIRSYGVKHVVLIGPMPEWNPTLPSVIASRHWGTSDTHITDPALDKEIMIADRETQRSIDHDAVTFVSLIDKMCVGNSCLVRIPGDLALLQYDASHLTEKGSIYVVKTYVQPELEKLYMHGPG